MTRGCQYYRLIQLIEQESDDIFVTNSEHSDIFLFGGKRRWTPRRDQIINRYPQGCPLGAKDIQKRFMAVSEHYNPEAYDFIPRSFVLPWDFPQFQNYTKIAGKNARYIAKPVHGAEGDDIILFKELKDWSTKGNHEKVVQRYINNPFLVNNRKFDLRLYVLSTGINEGNMQAFLHDEGLVRFCTEEYQKAETANFRHVFKHLTNSSINKHSKNYVDDVAADKIFEPNNSTTRTVTALWKEIEKTPGGAETVKTIKANIQKLCEATMTAVSNYMLMFSNPYILNQQRHDVFIYQPFVILGFDVMIDENLKAWLLEINASPSMGYIICNGSMGCNHRNCHDVSPVN